MTQSPNLNQIRKKLFFVRRVMSIIADFVGESLLKMRVGRTRVGQIRFMKIFVLVILLKV